MTEEVKNLIESVPTYNALSVSHIFANNESVVCKSDFDRVVEELTKWNKVEDIQPTGNIERSVLYKTKQGYISSICFKGCNSIFINNWLDGKGAIEWRYIY